LEENIIWQIIVFAELIVILVNSKQNKIVRAVKRLRAKSFGENVIYTSVIHKKSRALRKMFKVSLRYAKGMGII
jgi:hypothetical protein